MAILNVYALNNIGFFGGVFDIESVNSKVVIKDCVCEGNFAWNPIMSVGDAGGGSAVMVMGDQTTQVFTSNMVYFNQNISFRGIKNYVFD